MRLKPSGLRRWPDERCRRVGRDVGQRVLADAADRQRVAAQLGQHGEQMGATIVADRHEIGERVLTETLGQLPELDLHRHAVTVPRSTTDGCL